ncbi:restriction endonuclease subunit S [Apilactobacillus micheneri]|uniref:restriction endonuclease subunit S n=1 Tax=Apilactobacillus micheneri TaxID=1899430 RepID=UPI001CDA60FA|nr:restriction endonuclease subunit S [Apilactobacillus micheneri]
MPRLRFKGFEGEWEEKRLGDVSEKRVYKNEKKSIKNVLTDSAEFGVITQKNFFDKKIANSKNINGYYKVNPNDYIYNPRVSKFAKYGPIRRNKTGIKGIVSPLYYVFNINNNDYNFLDNYFISSKWHKFIYQNGNSGARSDRIAVKDVTFQNMPLILPKINEQEKIGSFFAKLDQLIDLQSKKVEQLKKLKHGYLQKMFPQKGESVPRLRFYGFSGEWEYKKISDISVSFSGGTPNISVTSYYNGEIPFIRSGEIDSKNTKINISEEGLKNSSAKLVDKGTILYALYGANSGEVSISKINGAINQAILAIKVNDYCNNIYIYNLLSYKKNYIVRKYLQGGQGNLSGKIINSLLLNIPQKQEQQKMGLFFNKLDQLINLQSQKEYNLRKIKQSYFQRLFI